MKFKILIILSFLCHAALCQDIIEDLTNLVFKHLSDSTEGSIEFALKDSVINKLEPIIYAVCRIKQTNGQQIEGILPLAEGSVNGLYFEGGKSDNWQFEPFYHLELYTVKLMRSGDGYTIYRNRGYNDTIRYHNVEKLYFMANQGSSRIGSTLKENATLTRNGRLIEFTNQSKNTVKYFMKDTLEIYQTLAPDTYIRKQVVKSIKVRITDIASLEFLPHPPKRWMELIKENRIATKSADKKWRVDSYSNWYHVVVADKRLKEIINNFLKMDTERSGWFRRE
ncbi:MAG: hypothetical protein JST14_00505 [Bacteroidetes bacterium]|nr:hypothetical protein [Bacteroidota bacterium]